MSSLHVQESLLNPSSQFKYEPNPGDVLQNIHQHSSGWSRSLDTREIRETQSQEETYQ